MCWKAIRFTSRRRNGAPEQRPLVGPQLRGGGPTTRSLPDRQADDRRASRTVANRR